MVESAAVGPLFASDTYMVEVEWDVPDLPRRVGPFLTRTEAEDWGRLNIVNGVWGVLPVAWPYLRPASRQQRTSPG